MFYVLASKQTQKLDVKTCKTYIGINTCYGFSVTFFFWLQSFHNIIIRLISRSNVNSWKKNKFFPTNLKLSLCDFGISHKSTGIILKNNQKIQLFSKNVYGRLSILWFDQLEIIWKNEYMYNVPGVKW